MYRGKLGLYQRAASTLIISNWHIYSITLTVRIHLNLQEHQLLDFWGHIHAK